MEYTRFNFKLLPALIAHECTCKMQLCIWKGIFEKLFKSFETMKLNSNLVDIKFKTLDMKFINREKGLTASGLRILKPNPAFDWQRAYKK